MPKDSRTPEQIPKMEKVSPEARARALALKAEGVSRASILRTLNREFPDQNFPGGPALGRWLDKAPQIRRIEEFRDKLRSEVAERTFADAKQQANTLIEMAERYWGLWLDEESKDKPDTLKLIRVGGEIRETIKAIRETLSPFQVMDQELKTSFEGFMETLARTASTQPASVQKALGVEIQN